MTTLPPNAPPPDRPAIQAEQLRRLRGMVEQLAVSNPFYAPRLRDAGIGSDLPDLAAFLRSMPYTTKAQIVADQRDYPPYGRNLTFPLTQYTRLSETSATTGTPLSWLDTAESWQVMLESWKRVYAASGVRAGDRVFFAFSFGPFLGFWTAFEAALQLGCLCVPGGGMSSEARLGAVRHHAIQVLCCTPTYAIRLGQAVAGGADDHRSVRAIIVAGEPGGSIPALRETIERLWPGARVHDHHGMTEVGPVSYTCPQRRDVLHVIESTFLPEVLGTDEAVDGETVREGELVLTTLRRTASPLLRYRTGDLVRMRTNGPCACGTFDAALEGGILGRVDDMVQVRGVNVYPSAVDQVVRRHAEVVEYRVQIDTTDGMAEMSIQVEAEAADPAMVCQQVADDMRRTFHLRVPVRAADPGSLPRFDMKARRWHRRR